MTDIYVGNLPFSTTQADLEGLFAPYSEVTRATIVTDRETGASHPFETRLLGDHNVTNILLILGTTTVITPITDLQGGWIPYTMGMTSFDYPVMASVADCTAAVDRIRAAVDDVTAALDVAGGAVATASWDEAALSAFVQFHQHAAGEAGGGLVEHQHGRITQQRAT